VKNAYFLFLRSYDKGFMQNIVIIFINETLIQYTNYKRSKTGLNRLTSTMFQLFWTHTSYLSYYHYQQQNMIPTLSYLSSICFT